MTPGEVSLITSTSQYAYDGRPDRPPGVPEGAKVEWEVELISFQKQPDWERAEPDAKIKHAGKQFTCMLLTLYTFHRHAGDAYLNAGDAQLSDRAAQQNGGGPQLNAQTKHAIRQECCS